MGEELSARPPRVNAMAQAETTRGRTASVRHRLLFLADEVAVIDADLGSAHADAWLVAAIDALAHALVDVADDAATVTISTPVQTVPPSHDRDSLADRASCAAAATQLRRAHVTMRSALSARTNSAATTIADDVGHALDMLATALQDVACEPGADRHQAVRAQAHRSIRAAHRLLQPDGQSPGPTPNEDSR